MPRVGKRFDAAARKAADLKQDRGQAGWTKGTSRRNRRKKK